MCSSHQSSSWLCSAVAAVAITVLSLSTVLLLILCFSSSPPSFFQQQSRHPRSVSRELHVDLELATLHNISDCSLIGRIQNVTLVGRGWTKAVYAGVAVDGAGPAGHVAVKTVDTTGRDVRQCVTSLGDENDAGNIEICLQQAHRKLLREAYLLKTLQCPHIIQFLSICLPPSNTLFTTVAMATELGQPADVIRLLQMTWEDRLKISVSLVELINCLAHNSLNNSIAINDFRRQQFVLVTRHSSSRVWRHPLGDSRTGEAVRTGVSSYIDIALSDVDDLGVGERQCTRDAQCVQQVGNVTARVLCAGGRCVGLNERLNIINTGQQFISFLLLPGTPTPLRPLVNDIVAGFSGLVVTPIRQLVDMFNELIDSYSSGRYLQLMRDAQQQEDHGMMQQQGRHDYTVFAKSDLPGLFDYNCLYSLASSTCTLTVFDEMEARDLCDLDPQCRAIVFSNETSWTGRVIVHLKNNSTTPTANNSTTLWLRSP